MLAIYQHVQQSCDRATYFQHPYCMQSFLREVDALEMTCAEVENRCSQGIQTAAEVKPLHSEMRLSVTFVVATLALDGAHTVPHVHSLCANAGNLRACGHSQQFHYEHALYLRP